MKLQALQADRNSPDHRMAVSGAACQLLAAHEDPSQCHPALTQMASGSWPDNVTAFLVSDAQYQCGLIALEADETANAVRLFALNIDPTLPARDHAIVARTLMSSAIYMAMVGRREQVVVDTDNGMPGLESLVREYGFRRMECERDWKLPERLAVLVDRVPAYGQGRWAAVLYNDEVTTMDVVTNAIKSCVGVTDEVASYLMFKVHLNGLAEVKRHYFQRSARRTKARLDTFFGRAGFNTRVEIHEHGTGTVAQKS